MPETVSVVKGFEPLLQAAARLQILAVLVQAQQAEFVRLKDLTGCSDSVMSKHLATLVDAGLIRLKKTVEGGRQRTWASVTRSGRVVFRDHVAALQRLVSGGVDPT